MERHSDLDQKRREGKKKRRCVCLCCVLVGRIVRNFTRNSTTKTNKKIRCVCLYCVLVDRIVRNVTRNSTTIFFFLKRSRVLLCWLITREHPVIHTCIYTTYLSEATPRRPPFGPRVVQQSERHAEHLRCLPFARVRGKGGGAGVIQRCWGEKNS